MCLGSMVIIVVDMSWNTDTVSSEMLSRYTMTDSNDKRSGPTFEMNPDAMIDMLTWFTECISCIRMKDLLIDFVPNVSFLKHDHLAHTSFPCYGSLYIFIVQNMIGHCPVLHPASQVCFELGIIERYSLELE